MAYISFQPSDYFNTKLYTGDGNATNAITSVGFQPDWVWIKNRGTTARHVLFDAVRGSQKAIFSHLTDAEQSTNQYGTLNSFDSDGFTVADGSSTGERTNNSSENYASWNWKANGAGSSNTDGSISSTVSASTTSGFSISQYTGTGANATIGHGLGVAPKIVLVKDLSASASWRMFTEMTGNESQLALDQTSAADSGNTTMWNSTSPTTTTFSIGTHGNVNTSSNNYVAYCFAEKKGFSKFGSYTGNGSTDGTFVYCGFKPAFLIQKRSDISANWNMYDNKRSSSGGFNVVDDLFYVDGSNAEISYTSVDFLSNGFKFRSADGAINSGANIFMAFAEEPLVSSNDIPATAR